MLAEDVVDAATKEPERADNNAPQPSGLRCPPTSALLLTEQQELDLVTFACERVEEMKRDKAEWDKERNDCLEEHENNFKHRVQVGTIYDKSNSSFNQSRRNCVPIVARLTRDFLGTDPFFAAKPVRRFGSTVEADAIQNYANFKLQKSRHKESLEDAIEMGAVVGERVEMITFERDLTIYKQKATVMMKDGQVVRTSQGKCVYDYDEWVDSSFFQQPPPAPAGTSGQPPEPPKPFSLIDRLKQWGKPVTPVPVVIPETGVKVLKKDPTITWDDAFTFVYQLVDQQDIRYMGVKVSGIAHGDFLCPPNADDIQTTPYIGRQFDMTVPDIVEKYYMAVDHTDLDPEETVFYKLLGEKLELLKGESADPKSEANKPDHDNKEQVSGSTDKYNQVVQLAEVYLRADPDGTGFQKEIMVVVALQQKFALFYDYTANITAPGVHRPFRVLRVTPKRGRWWGISEYKLNKHKQNFIDWCLNQVVWDNSTDGKYHIVNRDACEGWDKQEPQPGEKLHYLKKGFTGDPEKAITIIAPPPMENNLLDLMKNMMQSAQAERGNLSPGGDSLSQLPSSKLKYGIQAIQQSGDEIYALSAIHVQRGLTDITDAAIRTMLANMDPVEEFIYTDGDNYLTAHLNRSDIEDLDMNVSMEMTLTRGDQINEQNALAMQIVSDYQMKLPCDQADVRDFVIARLKSMDIQDAEKHVPLPSDADIALSMNAKRAGWQQQAMGGQPLAATPSAPAPTPVPPGPTEPPAKRI